ncbi:MAG TPA: glycogen synthase GlgA [Pararhizobium sp.]|nr:glycogen synthase GlgA [Pararhizobium sp.]
MQVLSVASEVFPLIKTGGLADVVGALPVALSHHGVAVRTLLPGYAAVTEKLRNAETVHVFADLFGVRARLLAAEMDQLRLLVLDAPEFFARNGNPYGEANGKDHPDNWKRFAALSKAGAEIAAGCLDGWQPDLVHAHDWQAALTPVYMRYGGSTVPSVMTVHNLAFQGQFGASIFSELQLPPEAFGIDGVEYYGDVGYLKGGLQSATAITTVSPTYAEEISTPDFGMGLDGLIRVREHDMHGIVNGIDTDIWNPETDPALPAPFSAAGLRRRAANRNALLERMGLDDGDGPLFAVVSRLTWQKGMDLLIEVIGDIVVAGGKLAVLGSGDAAIEGALLAAAARHRGRVAVVIGYDEPLSHLMQGGADAILIPSRFEPCGLTQLYALRYGSVPIVARTGGLADTIIDANEAALSAGVATGFQFAPGLASTMRHAIGRAMEAYAEPKVWTRLQRQGMKADVSWDKSAKRYAELYRTLTERAGG